MIHLCRELRRTKQMPIKSIFCSEKKITTFLPTWQGILPLHKSPVLSNFEKKKERKVLYKKEQDAEICLTVFTQKHNKK